MARHSPSLGLLLPISNSKGAGPGAFTESGSDSTERWRESPGSGQDSSVETLSEVPSPMEMLVLQERSRLSLQPQESRRMVRET